MQLKTALKGKAETKRTGKPFGGFGSGDAGKSDKGIFRAIRGFHSGCEVRDGREKEIIPLSGNHWGNASDNSAGMRRNL